MGDDEEARSGSSADRTFFKPAGRAADIEGERSLSRERSAGDVGGASAAHVAGAQRARAGAKERGEMQDGSTPSSVARAAGDQSHVPARDDAHATTPAPGSVVSSRHLSDPVLQARLLAAVFATLAAYAGADSVFSHTAAHHRVAGLAVAGACVAVAAALAAVPWRRLPGWSLIAFAPVLMAVLVALHVVVHFDVRQGPFVVLLFVWLGLTQSRWVCAALAPLVALTYLTPGWVGHVHTSMATVWIVLFAVILAAVGELLSWLMHGARLRVEALLASNTRFARELAARSRIAEIFATVADDEMYADVLDTVLEHMESPLGVFAYIDENGEIVCPSLTRRVWDECNVPDKTIRFEVDPHGGIEDETVITKKSQISNKPRKVPGGHLAIDRVMVVPMLHRDEVIGYFMVANRPFDYGDLDRRFLEGVAGHVAPVLAARLQRDRQERGRREAELERAALALRSGALYDFVGELSRCRTMRDLSRVAAAGALRATAAAAAAVWLGIPGSGPLIESFAGEPCDWDAVRRGDVLGDDIAGLFGGSLLTDRALEITTINEEDGEQRLLELAAIDHDGRRLGVLALAFAPESHIDEKAIEACADNLGVVVEGLRRFEDASFWAERDALTGTLNYRTVYDHLRGALERARAGDRSLALLVLDLDDLKVVNDTHGHAAGDTMIKAAAGCMTAGVRELDAVGRIGGDEFLAVLVDAGPGDCVAVARRILEQIAERRFRPTEGADVALSASIGLAVYPGDGADVDALFARADAMLYVAKAAGGMNAGLGGEVALTVAAADHGHAAEPRRSTDRSAGLGRQEPGERD